MSTSPQTPGQPNATPRRILATLQAYRDAAALNTAIELELFTRIAHGADTVSKVAGELGIPVRGVRLLCDYLVQSGLIEKEDEQLKLAADTSLFLDKSSTAYLGKAARTLYSAPLLRSFEKLTETIRAGRAPQLDPSTIQTPPDWFSIARGVTDVPAAAKAFAEKVKLPAGQPAKILEIGVQDGACGIALAMRYSDSVVVALDSAQALKTAQEKADAAGLGTRYQNISGDPLVVPLGLEYDAVVIAGSLHRFDSEQITSLLMRVRYALKITGQLLILEFLAGEPVDSDGAYAGFRLNMLAATPRGDVYSLADLKRMLETSGFQMADAEPLPAARATLVTARP